MKRHAALRTETRLFAFWTVFFLVVAVIYAWFTYGHELAGTAALVVTALISGVLTLYLWWTGRKTDERPEDDSGGEIAETAGDYGYFAPHSIWPPLLAVTASIACFGIAIGWWLVLLDVPLAFFAVIGWTFEHFRD
ncbi:cytochrome c oxidase subunit 4 [Flexivirga sp.]|uniref:cytochrome c oxidase subunit 4 n=1 Tax=Flexivirga sp. TaxID=1962927 RepID=UPI003F7E6E55